MTAVAPPAAGMGTQRARPVIVVTCPSEIAYSDDLCRAMMQSLARVAPDRVVRRAAPGEAAVSGEGTLAVALRLDGLGVDRMSGHLEWQDGDGARGSGPVVQLDVMDAQVQPAMFDQFTDGLVKASPDLLTFGSR